MGKTITPVIELDEISEKGFKRLTKPIKDWKIFVTDGEG